MHILLSFGLFGVVVNNGEEGIQKYKTEGGFDIIFTDMEMPIMNGIQMTQEIRKYDANIPIIFCTGNTKDYDMIRYMESGATSILKKPISKDELLAVLCKYN